MGLVVLGLNYRTAPLGIRERVVYTPEQAVTKLRDLKQHHAVPQAMLLSTCNRTELYAMVGSGGERLPELRQGLFYDRLGTEPDGDRLLYEWQDAAAVRHLFRVACGLDSMVLGEHEILAQVKAAYELSRSAETAGTVFHRLASRAFNLGKRARSETGIGSGGVSVAYAAIELAEKVFQRLEGRGALLVGAGENGRLCAERLLSRGVSPLIIANRTPAKADALAERLGGEPLPLARIGEVLDQVDIVVTTTGAELPIIDYALVRPAAGRRSGRSLVFVDVAVPRDVDPGVDRLQNVFRFDLDAVQAIVERNLERRREDAPAVEAMVETEVHRFMDWWSRIGTGPVIRDLNLRFETVRAAELERNARRFPAAEREQIERFTRTLVRKLLLDVTLEIKHYQADDPVQAERLASLRELFRLDRDEEPPEAEQDEEPAGSGGPAGPLSGAG